MATRIEIYVRICACVFGTTYTVTVAACKLPRFCFVLMSKFQIFYANEDARPASAACGGAMKYCSFVLKGYRHFIDKLYRKSSNHQSTHNKIEFDSVYKVFVIFLFNFIVFLKGRWRLKYAQSCSVADVGHQ